MPRPIKGRPPTTLDMFYKFNGQLSIDTGRRSKSATNAMITYVLNQLEPGNGVTITIRRAG